MTLRSPNKAQPARGDLDEALAKASRGASTINALLNRAWANNPATLPTDPTAASGIFVLAMKLTARASGIFMASINMSATGLTATDTVDTQVQVGEGSAITLANATQVGSGTAGGTSATANGVYVSNAAAGITTTGSGAKLVQYDSGTQVQGTGATTWQFSWSGIIEYGSAAFTVGDDVVVLASVNRSAASMTFASVGASLIELP